MIAANLPDVDVLAFVFDTPAVALRRGWTHGVLAQALLPILLTAAFVAVDRWRPAAASGARVRAPAMLLLAYAGVLSHVGMDWLNNYGVRLLMPLSGRWFYGDAVFIVDPWLWAVLGIGVLAARRRRRAPFARAAVALAAAYVLVMVGSARAAKAHVRDAWTAAHGSAPAAMMVGPVAVTPFARTVIVDDGTRYVRGRFRWWPSTVVWEGGGTEKNAEHAAVARARTEPAFRALLVWARFPFYELTRVPGGTRVRLGDMRFADRGLFTATTIVPDN
jgi:inner membrane protein